MTRIPVTKDGLALLRRSKAAVSRQQLAVAVLWPRCSAAKRSRSPTSCAMQAARTERRGTRRQAGVVVVHHRAVRSGPIGRRGSLLKECCTQETMNADQLLASTRRGSASRRRADWVVRRRRRVSHGVRVAPVWHPRRRLLAGQGPKNDGPLPFSTNTTDGPPGEHWMAVAVQLAPPLLFDCRTRPRLLAAAHARCCTADPDHNQSIAANNVASFRWLSGWSSCTTATRGSGYDRQSLRERPCLPLRDHRPAQVPRDQRQARR